MEDGVLCWPDWARKDVLTIYRTGVRYKVDTALTDDGTLASDHRPVFVDISL
jgi:hypothetical protein